MPARTEQQEVRIPKTRRCPDAWIEGLLLRDRKREKSKGASGADYVRLRHSRIDLVQVDTHDRQGHSYLCGPVCRADRNGYRLVSSKACGILA